MWPAQKPQPELGCGAWSLAPKPDLGTGGQNAVPQRVDALPQPPALPGGARCPDPDGGSDSGAPADRGGACCCPGLVWGWNVCTHYLPEGGLSLASPGEPLPLPWGPSPAESTAPEQLGRRRDPLGLWGIPGPAAAQRGPSCARPVRWPRPGLFCPLRWETPAQIVAQPILPRPALPSVRASQPGSEIMQIPAAP